MDVFRKQASPAAIRAEAAGLRWLAEAEHGAPVAELVAEGDDWLETRFVREAAATPAAAEEFGRRLAHTHAAGADWWGQAPPDVETHLLAELPLAAPGDGEFSAFGEFFAEARLLPYARMAECLDTDEARLIFKAIDVVAEGACDSPQPALVSGDVARIHGDLWGGNILWAPEGILIDPAAHGGHAETDLAALSVFGVSHLNSILYGYEQESPLSEDWQVRAPVHQFHMLLTHVALFGRSYATGSLQLANAILRKFGPS